MRIKNKDPYGRRISTSDRKDRFEAGGIVPRTWLSQCCYQSDCAGKTVMTGFWIFMLIMCLLTPTLMIGFGKFFINGGPKQMNGAFGYRTTRSMKNQETWEFAHQYSGKIWLHSGLALLPISIVTMLFVYGKSSGTIGTAGLILVMAQIIVMICAVPLTEAALKQNFDDSEGRG